MLMIKFETEIIIKGPWHEKFSYQPVKFWYFCDNEVILTQIAVAVF